MKNQWPLVALLCAALACYQIAALLDKGGVTVLVFNGPITTQVGYDINGNDTVLVVIPVEYTESDSALVWPKIQERIDDWHLDQGARYQIGDRASTEVSFDGDKTIIHKLYFYLETVEYP